MSNSNQLVLNFLNELHSGEVKVAFESLSTLLNHLETKNDPTQTEIHIINSIYQFVEKIKILEASLRIHANENSSKLLGSKLMDLYGSDPISVGTQKLFE